MTTEPTNPEAAPEHPFQGTDDTCCQICGEPFEHPNHLVAPAASARDAEAGKPGHQRYEPKERHHGPSMCDVFDGMFEQDDGDWVKADEAEAALTAAQARIAELERYNQSALNRLEVVNVRADELAEMSMTYKADKDAAEERAQKAEAEVAELRPKLRRECDAYDMARATVNAKEAELADLREKLAESEQSRELTCQAGHVLADQIRTLKSDIEGFRKWQRETEIERGTARASVQRLRGILRECMVSAPHPRSARMVAAWDNAEAELAVTLAEPAAPATAAGGDWISCAQWPPDAYLCDGGISRDSHATKEQAEAVCRLLEKNGFGGNREYFPIRTWVEQPTQPEGDGAKDSKRLDWLEAQNVSDIYFDGVGNDESDSEHVITIAGRQTVRAAIDKAMGETAKDGANESA